MRIPASYLFRSRGVTHITLLFASILFVAAFSHAQTRDKARAPEASVTGYGNPGGNHNPSCKFLAGLGRNGDVRFEHIIEDFELKLDFTTPNGSFPFKSGDGRSLIGPSNDQRFITVSSSGKTIHSWQSDWRITAVIIKGGPYATVFPYVPYAVGDTNLVHLYGDRPGSPEISHLTFCFEPSAGPSAATAAAGGRVLDSFGRGVAGARMTIQNASTGEMFSTITGPFGYYNFPELEAAGFYFVTVSHKRYSFGVNSKTFTLNDDLTDIDFVANP